MKSVGEVMAIGRSIEEILQKAIRNLDIWMHGVVGNIDEMKFKSSDLDSATPKRIFAIARAYIEWKSTEHIQKKTLIDPFFLEKIHNIVKTRSDLLELPGKILKKDSALIARAKKQWFSDTCISQLSKVPESTLRNFRKRNEIVPVIKKIDTLAGEFPSYTNYMFSTYHGKFHDRIPSKRKKKVIVLWSGSYRIGCSVEFDWCSVTALSTLRSNGYETIMINFNPETVSTDYDSSDGLYFDELVLRKYSISMSWKMLWESSYQWDDKLPIILQMRCISMESQSYEQHLEILIEPRIEISSLLC